MMELAVREDLLKGETPMDIDASGSPQVDKLALYERYKAGEIDRDTMVKGAAALIGTEMPSKTDPGVNNYVDHYGKSTRMLGTVPTRQVPHDSLGISLRWRRRIAVDGSGARPD